MMWKRAWGLGIVCVAATYFLSTSSRSEASVDFYIADEISIDGPALFYGVSEDRRQELWSVYCAQPLRSCVARASGLVLRIDETGAPWLLAVTPPGARVSIQSRNYTFDAPDTFSMPLDAEVIARLAGEQAFLIVEESGQVVLRSRTTGIDKVVDYLSWIQGSAARTLRDARLWPRNGEIRIQDMTPEVLERFEVMQRRALEDQRQLVPSTKPQIEFAIRAQGGASFFEGEGRSGY